MNPFTLAVQGITPQPLASAMFGVVIVLIKKTTITAKTSAKWLNNPYSRWHVS